MKRLLDLRGPARCCCPCDGGEAVAVVVRFVYGWRRAGAVLKALRAPVEAYVSLVFFLLWRGGGVVLLDALRKAHRALDLEFLSALDGLAVCFLHVLLNSAAERRRGFALPLLRHAAVFRLQAQVVPRALHRFAFSPHHSEAPCDSRWAQHDAESPRRRAGRVRPSRAPGGVEVPAFN